MSFDGGPNPKKGKKNTEIFFGLFFCDPPGKKSIFEVPKTVTC